MSESGEQSPHSPSRNVVESRPQQSDSSKDRGRPRSRERDPYGRHETRRSRSPDRQHRSRRKDAGFKWKDRRRQDDNRPREQDGGLRRGYREQYQRRSRSRSRSRSPRGRRDDRYDDRERGRDRLKKDKHSERPEKKERKVEKEQKTPAASTPVIPQQPMIVVTVNDRLGTKKQIPCFASDTVKDFKIIVASMIGRQPHEILLKRQGERPFKDVLTLQDYGVSNNVQLDLEVDTGD